MKDRSMANYLRQKLLARNGSNSAVAEIIADMSDEELVAKYSAHHSAEIAAQTARRA